jgi:hypothetical protein
MTTVVQSPPTLTQDQQDLVKALRSDAPDDPVLWGVCTGPQEDPHPEQFYLGHLNPGLCSACDREVETQPLPADTK